MSFLFKQLLTVLAIDVLGILVVIIELIYVYFVKVSFDGLRLGLLRTGSTVFLFSFKVYIIVLSHMLVKIVKVHDIFYIKKIHKLVSSQRYLYTFELRKKKLKTNSKREYKPMPKFLGLFSNSGLTTFLASTILDLSGAAATLLLPPFLLPFVVFFTAGFAGYTAFRQHKN